MNVGYINCVSDDERNQDLYVGMETFNVVAIQPTREELAAILNRKIDWVKEPLYIKDGVEVTNSKGQKVRGKAITIKIYCQSVNQYDGKNIILPISFYVQKGAYIGSQTGKHQVIDKYGNTAWVTADEFAKKEVPTYKNGSKPDIAEYRHSFRGEAELVNFFKTWLGIADPVVLENWNSETRSFEKREWKQGEDLKACEFSFEISDWEKIFNGNYEDLRGLLKDHEKFQFKGFLGVSNREGRDYQILSKYIAKNNAKNYDIKRVEKDLLSLNDKFWTIDNDGNKVVPRTVVKDTPVPTTPKQVESTIDDDLPF